MISEVMLIFSDKRSEMSEGWSEELCYDTILLKIDYRVMFWAYLSCVAMNWRTWSSCELVCAP